MFYTCTKVYQYFQEYLHGITLLWRTMVHVLYYSEITGKQKQFKCVNYKNFFYYFVLEIGKSGTTQHKCILFLNHNMHK